MGQAGTLIGVAYEVATCGLLLGRSGRHADAVSAMQQAYSACLMAACGLPVSVELRPPAEVPAIAHAEHFLFRIARNSLRVLARNDGIQQGISHLRRLGPIGALCGSAARMLSDGQTAECVVDIGDGADCGCYRRFAFSSASAEATLLPDPFFSESIGYEELRRTVAAEAKPWAERRPVVFWRGSLTGIAKPWPAPGQPLDLGALPRLALCAAARALAEPARADIGVTSYEQIGRPDLRRQIQESGLLKPHVEKSDFMAYRYLVDIDGNTNSWGLFEKLVMGATILKVESRDGFRQWYYDRLLPWTHYVPVAADLSDFAPRWTGCSTIRPRPRRWRPTPPTLPPRWISPR